MDILAREVAVRKEIAFFVHKGTILKGKFFLLRSNFSPLKLDTVTKGAQCIRKQTGNHKICLPLKKCWKIYHLYHFLLTTYVKYFRKLLVEVN